MTNDAHHKLRLHVDAYDRAVKYAVAKGTTPRYLRQFDRQTDMLRCALDSYLGTCMDQYDTALIEKTRDLISAGERILASPATRVEMYQSLEYGRIHVSRVAEGVVYT